jgi:hypothetical protein
MRIGRPKAASAAGPRTASSGDQQVAVALELTAQVAPGVRPMRFIVDGVR